MLSEFLSSFSLFDSRRVWGLQRFLKYIEETLNLEEFLKDTERHRCLLLVYARETSSLSLLSRFGSKKFRTVARRRLKFICTKTDRFHSINSRRVLRRLSYILRGERQERRRRRGRGWRKTGREKELGGGKEREARASSRNSGLIYAAAREETGIKR